MFYLLSQWVLKRVEDEHSAGWTVEGCVDFNVFSLQQSVSAQCPPPVVQSAQGVGQSSVPLSEGPQAAALPLEQTRKPGQNFKCLWQACKRYRFILLICQAGFWFIHSLPIEHYCCLFRMTTISSQPSPDNESSWTGLMMAIGCNFYCVFSEQICHVCRFFLWKVTQWIAFDKMISRNNAR